MHSHQMRNTVPPPWSVQVELTEGCSRLCAFCGLNAIRRGPGDYKFLELRHATTMAQSLTPFVPTARYEFAMHGEPTMNPAALDIVREFRRRLPRAQLQLTTNGVTFRTGNLVEKLLELFTALDFIVVDTYEPERALLQRRLREAHGRCGIQVVDFYADRVQVYGKNHLQRTVVIMDDISLRQGESLQRKLLNHAGSNPTMPIAQLHKTCALPFRELSVCWNGDVNVCCMDWKHEAIMGNLLVDPARAVWHGERFQAARATLAANGRDFDPCRRCTKGAGTRIGLLPKYDPPTLVQRALLP